MQRWLLPDARRSDRRFSTIEAEAELIQVRLKLLAAAVIRAEQERLQITDGFVQPMQIAGFVLFASSATPDKFR